MDACGRFAIFLLPPEVELQSAPKQEPVSSDSPHHLCDTHCWFSKSDQSRSRLTEPALGYCGQTIRLSARAYLGTVQLLTLIMISVQIQPSVLMFRASDFCYTNCTFSLSPCFRGNIHRSFLDDWRISIGQQQDG